MRSLPGVTIGSRVLDCGCGAGSVLLDLASKGFWNLIGSDFRSVLTCMSSALVVTLCSLPALDLAASVAAKRASEGVRSCQYIGWLQDDALHSSLRRECFDVVHDKGTLDAIALSDDRAATGEALGSH